MRTIAILWLSVVLSSSLFADNFIIDEPEDISKSVPQPQRVIPRDSTPKEVEVENFGKVKSPNGYYKISIGSIPTAHTLSAGKIETEFVFYENGGFTTRMLVGIFDALSIGISENIDNLIGYTPLNFNIPGAYLKFSVFRNLENFNLSVGFDSFAYGKNGSYTDSNQVSYTVYGFYIVGGWDYSIFGGNDGFHFGLRFPLFPFEFANFANTSLFLGATLELTDTIELSFTLENLYLDLTRLDRVLPSFIITVIPTPSFRLFASLQYEFHTGRFNRILGLHTQFGF